jgi:DNA repair photolyase
VIVSASRRTDIPAFYSEWLMNRLKEGYALIPNPRNPLRFSHVELNPQAVDCIVFWTKNPGPMLSKLDKITAMGYPYYFQFTLTPYGPEVEQNLPSKNVLIKTFQRLSSIVGSERVVWRYDPVILTDQMDIEYHMRCFEKMAAALEGCTSRCIFSFLDFYHKVRRLMQGIGALGIQETDMLRFAEGFSQIAQKHRLRLFTCCEPVGLSQYGIYHASCIDATMIGDILGCSIHSKKDNNQRPNCGCIESVEIGTYDCCPHGCKYCYATSAMDIARNNAANHNPKAPVLFGPLPENAIITERQMSSIKKFQVQLF